jgi:hypothetical protein
MLFHSHTRAKNQVRTLEKGPLTRALVIGINYKSTPIALKGCINDALNYAKYIRDVNFTENIKIMSDDLSKNSTLYPSHNNIIENIKWLVEGTKSGDHLFFSYSGHGGQTIVTGITE